MSNYYLHLVSLQGCPYSKAAEELLTKNNYTMELTQITYDLKDNWKSEKISTFPQIYFKKNGSSGSILIGGYDKMSQVHNIINSTTQNNIKENANKLKNMYPEMSYKSCLRLMQLKKN